jgi:antibiotic biosynthesis monooxygenase (ABM) superfamily enzyme
LIFKAGDFGNQEIYADWVDTDESQNLLQYQSITFDDFRRETYERFKWLRYPVKPFSPAIKWGMKLFLERA